LSPERLLLSLEPSVVRWLRVAGAFSPRAVDKGAVPADPAFGTEPWHGALEALRRAQGSWGGGRLQVRAVLSNHFVRYAAIPASAEASGRAEELALARFYFTKMHGERAKAWELRLSPARGNAPRLACAIDRELLHALKACFPKSARARLASLQPYLMSAFNLWRARVPKDGAWLLLPEPDRACLALYAGGGWRAVQNLRGSFQTPAELEALLERERLRTAVDPVPRTVLVRAEPRAVTALGAPRGWNLSGLALPALAGSAVEEEAYALGLTAR
jgi:hypothetical protein